MKFNLLEVIKGLKRESKKKEDRNRCIQYVGGRFINICEEDERLEDSVEVESVESKNLQEELDRRDLEVEYEEKTSDDKKSRWEVAAKRGRPSASIRREFERAIRLNHSVNTSISYLAAIKFWERIAKDKGKNIYRLTAKDMEEVLERYANRTRIQRMASLRKLAKIYLRNGYPSLSAETSMVMISGRRENHIIQYLDEESYVGLREKIIEGLEREEREYLWLGLFLFCGLRISEIQTIIIENEKFIKVLGKGDKERLVPCPSSLIGAIRTFKNEGYKGWRKTGKAIDIQLRRRGMLDKFHCHQLRHTFATRLYRQGVQLNTIKEIMGHNTIMTTQIYAKAKIDEGLLEYIELE